jgi:hypothetical protein
MIIGIYYVGGNGMKTYEIEPPRLSPKRQRLSDRAIHHYCKMLDAYGRLFHDGDSIPSESLRPPKHPWICKYYAFRYRRAARKFRRTK